MKGLEALLGFKPINDGYFFLYVSFSNVWAKRNLHDGKTINIFLFAGSLHLCWKPLPSWERQPLFLRIIFMTIFVRNEHSILIFCQSMESVPINLGNLSKVGLWMGTGNIQHWFFVDWALHWWLLYCVFVEIVHQSVCLGLASDLPWEHCLWAILLLLAMNSFVDPFLFLWLRNIIVFHQADLYILLFLAQLC